MAEKVFIPSIPVITDTNKFNGTTPAKQWLIIFNALSAAYHWDDQAKTSNFIIFMTGPAENWYNSFNEEQKRLGKTITWKELETAFTSAFDIRCSPEKRIQEIKNRKKLTSETYEEYYYHLMWLCDLASTTTNPISNETRVRYILKGIDKSLAKEIYTQGIRNPSEILDKFRDHEKFEAIYGKNSQPQVVYNIETSDSTGTKTANFEETLQKGIESLKDHFDHQLNQIEKKLSRIKIDQRNQNRRFRERLDQQEINQIQNTDYQAQPRNFNKQLCNFCNRSGHFLKECRAYLALRKVKQ